MFCNITVWPALILFSLSYAGLEKLPLCVAKLEKVKTRVGIVNVHH
jgi:hypothetical protein